MSTGHLAAPNLAIPKPEQIAWQRLELGMFIHWSPTTYMNRFDIYDDLSVPLQEIHPVDLDTEQWVDVAESMNAKYIVIVAKHVGGFCIWQTDTTEYSIKNTPFRDGQGDIMQELADTCRRRGMKFGVYLSPQDIHMGAKKGGVCATAEEQERYHRVFRQQLTELLTRYGSMCEVWFDGSVQIDVGDILAEHAPDAMIFQSQYSTIRWVGNEQGFATYPAWNSVTAEDARSGIATQRHGTPTGDHWMPLECDARIRDHWFWRPNNEATLKSVEQLMEMYYRSVGHGAVLLLNHTPDRSGLIPAADVERAAQFGEEIRQRFGTGLKETHGEGMMIELSFEEPTEVNHLILMEQIAQGERVRAYVIEGLYNGEWFTITNGTAIGYKKIDYFPTVKVNAIRCRCTHAAAVPIFERMAAFHTTLPEKLDAPVGGSTIEYSIGKWGPEIFWGSREPLVIDITALCDDAGQYEVLFKPSPGQEIEVETLTLICGGSEQPQWITPGDSANAFHLSLTAIGETLSLMIRLNARNKEQSTGSVWLKKL